MKMTRNMNNQEIARLLRSVAAAYEIRGENRFRIMAYDRAATAVEHATSELKDLWDDQKLEEIPGVGKNIASHLDELFRTGKVGHFKHIFQGLSPAVFEIINIPGIGPKTAYKLSQKLKITNPKTAVRELTKAAKLGKIAAIEGFGEKSQQDILDGITALKKGQSRETRMVLPYADEIARKLLAFLKESPATIRTDPLGSLRRRVATIGDIDVSVATDKPAEVVEKFLSFPSKQKVIEKGPTGASIVLNNGRQVDLRVQSPKSYGAMLQYFTGSKQHNINLREFALKKGLSLSEYGIKTGFKTKSPKLKTYASEEEFYQALGLAWIPPELREGREEIESALRSAAGKLPGLPKLVELKDVRGDLHTHSNFPVEESHDPGTNTLEEMIKTAEGLKYEYIGFSEHNPSQSNHSEKDIINLIKNKKSKIEQLNYSRTHKILCWAFNGLEVDIKPNGDLAISEEALSLLDYAIASVHSEFGMGRKEMTERVLRGLSHPKVRIFGHPTGRMLGEREGYELDWEKIFDFCLENHKWVEINAWPVRLDLPDSLVREAVKRGVKMVINTDSHAKDHLSLMEYGVSVARRGWATAGDIINTLSCDKIKKLILEN